MNTIIPGQINNLSKKQNTGKTFYKHPPCKPVSFKGPATLITEADRKILNVFSQHYGNIGERLGQKIGKLVTSSEILKKSSRFSLEQGALSIREKKVGQALVENVLFPFVNLPLYAVSWVLKKVQSVPALKEGARRIYNKPILRIPRKLNELDAKTDSLKGIFDKTQDVVAKFAKEKGISTEYLLQQLNKTDDNPQAQQLVKEASEYIKESLYKVSNKFFDKHTGNFNTAYERPLNRIITGLIPVAFLANDAYNLSVLCGDTKEESKKEATERKQQEISRVFTTAYIQLLTFGAFTKQVNTIPWFTPLTSAATVLFSEITSRKRLGKPIFFINKEQAKEYNRRDAEKAKKEKKHFFRNNKTEDNKPQQVKQIMISDKDEPKVFTSFKSSFGYNPKQQDVNGIKNFRGSNDQSLKNTKTDKKEESKKSEPRKALINFKTFKNGVAILVSAGFILSFLKNSSYTKNSKIVRGIQNFGKFCKKKLYDPLAFKDFEITHQEFDKVAQSLKDAGCKEIAEGHRFIKDKYGKETASGVIKMYKASISSSKIPEIIQSSIEKLKAKGIAPTDKEITQIRESVSTAIGLEGSAIAEKKYEAAAKKAIEIIKNKKLNLNEQQVKDLQEILTETIGQSAKEAPIRIETKIKPFVDIVTQPFKFIMSAMKLPFKITSSLIKIAVSPVEKKAAQAALGKAELTKFEKSIHKAVTEIFGEKQAKTGKISQVIFANAMDQLERQTRAYRNAQETLKNIISKGRSKAEVEKAKAKLEKAKIDLMKYVNTAVEKSFNGVTQSSNKNTDLAMMSKLASSAVTSAFLVADNYNMVMLKSNGEDKEGAKETANERIIQRLSALFYQTLFINWFNATFRSTYNSSLKGMAAVAIPNTLTTEVLTRKSIGMPIGRKSFEELQENEGKNENREGFLGKYFKFMRLLTGKKPLKDRIPKEKKQNNKESALPNVNSTLKKDSSSTNLLELLTKQNQK